MTDIGTDIDYCLNKCIRFLAKWQVDPKNWIWKSKWI